MAVALELETQLAATTTDATVVVEGDENDPSIPTEQYRRMQPRWEKCRACFLGTEAIRAGRTTYLPQHPGESDARYEIRRVLAAFYNGYARTVLAAVGMLLDPEPALGTDMPAELAALWENIDAGGTHGAVFTRRMLTWNIQDSHGGIMVEHTRADDPRLDRSKLSLAGEQAIAAGKPLDGTDEAALGMRPYFLLFRADDVIRPMYETVNGVSTLVLLVLREVVRRKKGLFGTEKVTQYRVYRNTRGAVTYELWRAPDGGGDIALAENARPIANQTEIPWSPMVSGEEVAPGEYKPAMLDLADKNIQYHNTETNILSLQAQAFVPTLVRIGAQPDKDGNYPEVILGPGQTIEAPFSEGIVEPLYWLSPTVDVLAPGEKTLASTKADMGTLGAAFLSAETRAAETAEGKRIDSAASRATLKSTRRAAQDCLERAFQFAGNYRKLKAGSVKLNDDFTGEGIDTALVGQMIAAFQAGAIDMPELRTFLQTGQLPETFKADDIAKVLRNNAALPKEETTSPDDTDTD